MFKNAEERRERVGDRERERGGRRRQEEMSLPTGTGPGDRIHVSCHHIENNKSWEKWLIARQHKVFRKEREVALGERRWWGSLSYRGEENCKRAWVRERLREWNIKWENAEKERERCRGGEGSRQSSRQLRVGWRVWGDATAWSERGKDKLQRGESDKRRGRSRENEHGIR